jgi:hypothetical protein
MSKPPPTTTPRQTIVVGMLSFVLLLVIMQLWLLMATMNAYLAHDYSIVWPAAGASLACFVLNLGLLFYLFGIERA